MDETYKMTVVVCLAIVITQETHRVISSDVLGVLLHERFRAVPQRWNRFDILVQAQHKAVLLLVILHVFEWIIVNVTKQLNARLNPPVVLELIHERMSEEEARLETAHMPIAD